MLKTLNSNFLKDQNRNFRPKCEGRSGRRPLLPKRKLNILTLISTLNVGKIIPFCRNFFACSENYMLYVLNPDLIEIDLLLCMSMESWTLGFLFFIRNCRNRVAKYFVEWKVPGLTEICTNQRPKMPRKVVTTSFGEKCFV